MENCTITEPLSTLQYKKKKYVICPIHDGESLLAYWYCILKQETYNLLQQSETVDAFEKFEQELLDKAIDIRKLHNYNKLSISQIVFNRKALITPLIREAIRTETIMPH